jgi:hypothetical protein
VLVLHLDEDVVGVVNARRERALDRAGPVDLGDHHVTALATRRVGGAALAVGDTHACPITDREAARLLAVIERAAGAQKTEAEQRER